LKVFAVAEVRGGITQAKPYSAVLVVTSSF